MREAGRVVASVIALLREAVRPGMRTQELDAVAAREIKRLGAKPAFLGYRGFPATICVSLNEEIVHGIPGSRIIEDGDLVKMDVGAIVDGLYGDAAVSVQAGTASPEAQALLQTSRESLERGIEAVCPGARLGDIGAAVQQHAESRGYGVVREYVGHGIGRLLHEEPQVPNYGRAGRGARIRRGMAIAVEPMLNIGTSDTQVEADGWTVSTADGSLSAHFEDTIAITEDGPVVTTQFGTNGTGDDSKGV
jgi:methionyl aminopeptidase